MCSAQALCISAALLYSFCFHAPSSVQHLLHILVSKNVSRNLWQWSALLRLRSILHAVVLEPGKFLMPGRWHEWLSPVCSTLWFWMTFGQYWKNWTTLDKWTVDICRLRLRALRTAKLPTNGSSCQCSRGQLKGKQGMSGGVSRDLYIHCCVTKARRWWLSDGEGYSNKNVPNIPSTATLEWTQVAKLVLGMFVHQLKLKSL